MNIKWNEVTWYSKLFAAIFLLGVLPVLAFYIGTQYELAIRANSVQVVRVAGSPEISNSKLSGWKTYLNPVYGFSVQYPAEAVPVDTTGTEGISFQKVDSQGNVTDDLLEIDITKDFWLNGKLVPVTSCGDVESGDPGDSSSLININGVIFQKYAYPTSYDVASELRHIEYCTFHNAAVYSLSLAKAYDGSQIDAGLDNDPASDPVLNQMARSFRFQ